MVFNKLVVTYGFEYDKIITFTGKSNICKSFISGNPVYCSIMIADTNVQNIINKIKIIESKHNQYLNFIDDLASLKDVTPKWQMVIYNKDYNNYIRDLQN
jgi:hypothetical protein